MLIYLQHIEGSKKGQIESLDLNRIRIGRQADNDLRFDPEKDPMVSGHHAEISCQGEAISIKDLQSRNGTYVNGRRISQPTPLADGDILQFSPNGPKVVFLRRNPSTETAAVVSEGGESARPEAKKEAAILGTRGLIGLAAAGLLALGVLVFAAWTSRWILLGAVILFVVVASGGFFLWWWMRVRSPRPAPHEAAPAVVRPKVFEPKDAESLNELRNKWAEGLATLRKSKFKEKQDDPTYSVPWFLAVGESGSGKTEAIRAASPLSWLSSSGPRQGLTGTRSCDWWFFDNAVVLDTAGRYTFPVAEQVDGAEWQELLSLLRRSRPQEPINGVILAVAGDALATRPAERLQEQASQIRRRLDEMGRALGTTFPVYLLVTKIDMIPGFAEFFSGLPEAMRGQGMGSVNEDPDSRTGATAFFDRGFQAVSDTLDRLRLTRMDEEESPNTLRKLFLFPEEFRSLRGPLRTFTAALFRQNPYQETPLLRGLFFASARQGEAPLSRVAQALGFPGQVPEPAATPGTFFARDIFSVILPQDRPLVGRTTQWQHKSDRVQLAALVVTVVASLLLAALLTISFIRNSQALSRLDLGACLTIPGPSADGSLAPRLKALDGCREVIEGLAPRSFWGKVASDFGLGQAGRIEEPLRVRYVQAFRTRVLDPLDARLDQKLLAGVEAPAYVGALLQRVRLVRLCRRSEGCPHGEGGSQAQYRVMLTAEDPSVKDGDLRIEQLARTYGAFLRWQADARALEEMQTRLVLRVTRWLNSGGLRPDWILASASSRFPPVRSRDFWGVDVPGQVDSPYTRQAWTEGIQPLVTGLAEMAPETKEVAESLTRFEADYRRVGVRQWEQFLLGFPQGEKQVAGRGANREFASRVLGAESPYWRVLSVASSSLAGFLPASAREPDVPSWAMTLRRFEALRGKLGESQQTAKPDSEARKTDSADQDREATRILAAYLGALDRLRAELSTPEKAFRAAKQAFEEGEPSDAAGSVLLKAVWNRNTLRQAIGTPQGEDRLFWVMVSRPMEFGWRAVLDQGGVYVTQQWEALRLELTELPPGQKAGKVLAFVNGQLAPFLERRRDGYTAKTVLNETLSFTRAFLDYLSRSSSVAPDDLGKLEPPSQIVASL